MSPSKHPVATDVTVLSPRYPKGDLDNFSLKRCAVAIAEAQRTAPMGAREAWKTYAPWEAKFYAASRNEGRGILWSDYINGEGGPNLKAGAEITGQDGGFLAPSQWAPGFFGLLRAHQVLAKVPTRFRTTTARTAYGARLTADWTVGYFGENATLTDSTASFSQSTWTPRKQAVIVKMSREYALDSDPDAAEAFHEEAADLMAVDRDKQALLGNGQGGVPTGLQNMTNVTTSSLAATPTYANVVAAVANVRNLNASANVPAGQADCTGVIYHSQFESTVASMLDSQNHPLWPFGLQQGLSSLNFLAVPSWVPFNGIPSGNTASIFYGDWKNLVVRTREDLEFSATYEATAFAADQLHLKLISRWDVAAVHPEAFFVHTNAHA